jgi:F-box associated protein
MQTTSSYVFVHCPATTAANCYVVDRVTVDVLPDETLLEIFAFHVQELELSLSWTEAWLTLAHVSRRWRHIVFESPRRLNLRLECTPWKPVRKTLDVWPPFPIVITDDFIFGQLENWPEESEDNVIAALEHKARVCELVLTNASSLQWKEILPAMQEPFPALTRLDIRTSSQMSVVPDSFLGGSAPRLQSLFLRGIPFPGLPKLLPTAADLVHVRLWRIPPSGYIPPETLVTCLSMLTSLQSFHLEFESPRPRTVKENRRPLLPTRTLPSLTYLCFQGVSEYLEEVVARIDAPLLNDLDITFFNQLIFDTPQLAQFISRTPQLKAYCRAHMGFSSGHTSIGLVRTEYGFDGGLWLRFSCRHPDWQLASLEQACISSFPQALLSTVERLDIHQGEPLGPHQQDDIENGQWLELLRSFIAVKVLYLAAEIVPSFASALQELVGDRVIEVLPALQGLFLGEHYPSRSVKEALDKFTDSRQFSERPIAISY